MAYLVEADTIADAWLKAVCKVYYNGHIRETEYENNAITLDAPLVIHVESPHRSPNTCDEVSDFKSRAIDDYVKSFVTIKDTGHDYTYPNRLFDYPKIEDYSSLNNKPVWSGDGLGNGFNQIDNIVKSLVNAPITRRAVAHTWVPEKDTKMKSCPCLQDIQYYVLRGRLCSIAHFRSNDILDAWLANANGLYSLQNMIGNTIFKCDSNICGGTGYLETYSVFPHIYSERIDTAKRVVEYALKKFGYAESERLYVA